MTFNIFSVPGLEDLQLEMNRASYIRILQTSNQAAKHDEFTNADIGCIFDHHTKEIIARYDEKTKTAVYDAMILKTYPSWTIWDNDANKPIKTTYDKLTWDDGTPCASSDFVRIGNNRALAQQADNFVLITKENFSQNRVGTAELKPRILAIARTDNKETVATCDKLKVTLVKLMQDIFNTTGKTPKLWEVPFRITVSFEPNGVTKDGKGVSYFYIQSIKPIPDEKTGKAYIQLTDDLTASMTELYIADVQMMNKPITCYQPQIAAPAEVVTQQQTPVQLVEAEAPPPPPNFETSSVRVDTNSKF